MTSFHPLRQITGHAEVRPGLKRRVGCPAENGREQASIHEGKVSKAWIMRGRIMSHCEYQYSYGKCSLPGLDETGP
jgi:hypothetical protein